VLLVADSEEVIPGSAAPPCLSRTILSSSLAVHIFAIR
jgi:hypothetical protein